MATPRLLIADSNEEFHLALTEALQGQFHIRCCRDGKTALALLRQEPWDIFVLDLMLPELDGITLLERAVAEDIHPKVMVVTSLVNPYVLASAERLGIYYVMRKPCDADAAAERICDLNCPKTAAPPRPDPKLLVPELLLSFSLRAQHRGYSYLREAILLMLQSPGQAITKELYPAVAAIFKCKPGHVERSIRSALEVAWEHRDEQLWLEYFPTHTRRPSNTEFILRLTEDLRRKLKQSEL